MPKVHDMAAARKDRELLTYLYQTFEIAAPRYKKFTGIKNIYKEFAMAATSAWLRVLRLALQSNNIQLTTYLLPSSEEKATMVIYLLHFEITERQIENLLVRVKQKLFENKSSINLPHGMLIKKQDSRYFLEHKKLW